MEDVKLFIKFLKLAQRNFKNERSINFYAEKLGVTSEELSRVIWDTSDSSLSEWMDVLEKLEAETGNCCVV